MMVKGGGASGILSIRGPEVSLGSLGLLLYMVSRLHRMRRRFEGLSANSLTRGRGFVVSRGFNGATKIDEYVFNRPKWTLPLTNGRKRT